MTPVSTTTGILFMIRGSSRLQVKMPAPLRGLSSVRPWQMPQAAIIQPVKIPHNPPAHPLHLPSNNKGLAAARPFQDSRILDVE